MTKGVSARLNRDCLATPDGLLDALSNAAPSIAVSLRADMVDDTGAEHVTMHSVMQHFRGCFREDAVTDSELSSIANLIAVSLEVQDELENAMMTCFIEGGIGKRLRAHLTRGAKAHIRTN